MSSFNLKHQLSLIFALLILILPLKVEAMGFEVSPIRKELFVEPGKVIEQTLTITNRGKTIPVSFSVSDFTFKDESGTPKIVSKEELGDGVENIAVSEWLEFPESELELVKDQPTEITYKIKVPKDANPGGHYGMVFVQQAVDEDNGSKLSAITKVGAILILNVEGEIRYVADIKAFEIVERGGEIIFQTRIINLGNVHLVPEGKISITSIKGESIEGIDYESVLNDKGIIKKVDKVDYLKLNREKFLVLPDQTRLYESALDKKYLSDGDYQAQIEVNYGEDQILAIEPVSFTIAGGAIISSEKHELSDEDIVAYKAQLLDQDSKGVQREYWYFIGLLFLTITLIFSLYFWKLKKLKSNT